MGSLNGKRGQDRGADLVVSGRPRALPHVWDSMERAPHLGRLTLVCFGPPTARLDGRDAPPEVLWRKNLALLIYLALAPQHRRSRNQVLRVLWPDKDESRARHSLNESVHRLRSCLGQARLESQGDSIALSGQGLEVDALRLAGLAPNKLADAFKLLRGDFLEGFTVEDAPEFEDWASTERAGWHAKATTVLVALGEALLVEGRSSFADAREAARRALALDRYAEPAVRLAMRAAALAGDQAGALKAHHDFVLALREIGEHPSREFAALADRIRSDRWRPSGPTTRADEPPLVGRAAEGASVARALAEGLASGPRTIAITGDPGAGKTRLLNHCLERVALEGALVLTARPLEGDRDTPWSTLRALTRAGLLNAPGLPATDPHGLSVLASLIPELASRIEPREPRDRGEVAAALASVLEAIADETPLALALDEAQYADGATVGALHAAVTQLRVAPVVIILTSTGSPESATTELLQLHRDIGRGLAGAVVQLEPLTFSDIGELVVALAPWCGTASEQQRLARRIAFETRGNAFLAVTLLRGLQDFVLLRSEALTWPPPDATLESPLPMVVPDLVRRTIMGRLAELDRETRAILGAASIGGAELDLALISALTGLNGALLEERLALLERQRFLVFDNGRYLFAAPLIEQVVRAEGLTPGQASGLRRRAIDILATQPDLESRTLRAELLARTSPGVPAFQEAIAVAQAALGAKGQHHARRALRAAERSIASDPLIDRSELDQLRAQLAR
jgi:DNA-binding SARP family transcriptional activator